MSSEAEDKEESELETVNSVTLTQDSDGSIILHCSPNGGFVSLSVSSVCLSKQYNTCLFVMLSSFII